MVKHDSARLHQEASHVTNYDISEDLKRRARSVINNKSLDAGTRNVIRYGLEINDPLLPELVRRIDAGETIIDDRGRLWVD